jgi:hypothetical protein
MSRLACLTAALLAALLLGGCGGGKESTASPAGEQQPVAVANRIPQTWQERAMAAVGLAPPHQAKVEVQRTPPPPAKVEVQRNPPPPAKVEVQRNGGKGAGLETTKGGARAAATTSAALAADEQRTRRRDDYIAGLKQGAYTFNPPSPIKVDARITVALWVDPVKEAAQLAEEMKKAFPASAARVEAGATAWSPRMRATLTGPDFEITPVESKDFKGVKDLSMNARTEWGWTLVPKLPGKKQLHLLLAVVLPPELGEPRELPTMSRDVEVEVSVWWLLDHYWEKYWKWVLSGLGGALAAAIGWWWKKRSGGSAG